MTVRRVLIALLVVLAIVVGADTLRIGGAIRDIRAGGRLLQQATDGLGTNPSHWTNTSIRLASRQQQDGAEIVGRSAPVILNDPVLRAASAVPLLRDQVLPVMHAANAAEALAGASGDIIAIARTYAEVQAAGGSQPSIFLRFLSGTQNQFRDASQRLAPVAVALKSDLSRPLLEPIRAAVAAILQPLGVAADLSSQGSSAAAYLPQAMGSKGPRTYLILLANPSEIRPSGGFYGAVGYVTFNDGTPTALEIRGSDQYDQHIRESFPVPTALGRYLIFPRNSLEIGDSGWDPDFPTTAQLTESMMKAATGRQVDGTISFDPYAVQALLSITGPVVVPPYGEFTGDNFFVRLNVIVNADASGGGTAAIGPIAQTVLSTILSQPADSWPRMWAAVAVLASERHVVMFSHEPALENELARIHLDGALRSVGPETDYLAVVDANVGGTKGDAYVRKRMNVKVERYSTGIARHEVAVRYEMPPPVDATDRALNPHGGGAYRDYVRFYIPETATVSALNISVDDKPSDANSLESLVNVHHKRVAATFLNVPRGHSMEVHLYYEVPLNPTASYSLLIQKQAGTLGLPTTADVSLPGPGIRRISLKLHQDEYVSLSW